MQIRGKIFGTNEKLLTVENGRITKIGGPEGEHILDFGENFILPGFIDIHTHGAKRYDTMDGTDEAMLAMKKHMADNGVTAFLPTTVTMPTETLSAAIRVAQRNAKGNGAEILGVHLEGPFFSPKALGAQNPAYLREATVKETDALLDAASGFIRIMSVAPEMPGAMEVIAHLKKRGVKAAMGHTAAEYETAVRAIECGATMATHVYNCMSPLTHRAPGVVGAALEHPDVYAELICDGVHVSPAAAKIAIRAKGSEKIVLISDSIRAAGMPDGEYELGGKWVKVIDGVARTHDGNLAGSTATVLECFRNVVRWGIPFDDAVRMASENPARAIGCENKGRIQAGCDGDFVVLSPALDLIATSIGGEVWKR